MLLSTLSSNLIKVAVTIHVHLCIPMFQAFYLVIFELRNIKSISMFDAFCSKHVGYKEHRREIFFTLKIQSAGQWWQERTWHSHQNMLFDQSQHMLYSCDYFRKKQQFTTTFFSQVYEYEHRVCFKKNCFSKCAICNFLL